MLQRLFAGLAEDELAAKEASRLVAFELHWLAPAKAQVLVDWWCQRGYLEGADGEPLRLAAEILTWKGELGDPKAAAEKVLEWIIADGNADDGRDTENALRITELPTSDVFPALIEWVAREAGAESRSVVKQVNQIRKELPLESEVLVLAVARELGVDIGPALPQVRSILSRRFAA